MKIVNNKITIAQGETPTYDAVVLSKDNGSPFIIQTYDSSSGTGVQNPVIEFVVRPSVYDRLQNYAFRAYLKYAGKTFVSTEIKDYTGGDIWDNDVSGDSDYLYKLVTNESTTYRYYENGEWHPYELRIVLTLPYEATSLMEVKTYKYEITLFGGSIDADATFQDDEIPLSNIEYKKPLLEPTDFIVGGSISE